MSGQKKRRTNVRRSWLLTLSVFVIMLVVFYLIDGTTLEPRLNDSNNIAGRMVDWLNGSTIFNEWITFFTFPWFNLVTFVFILALLLKAITDLISLITYKRKPRKWKVGMGVWKIFTTLVKLSVTIIILLAPIIAILSLFIRGLPFLGGWIVSSVVLIFILVVVGGTALVVNYFEDKVELKKAEEEHEKTKETSSNEISTDHIVMGI